MKDSTISKRMNEKSMLAARLSGYAAVAGALVTLMPEGKAQVIYSGPVDSMLNAYEYLYLDINNDNITDVRFGGYNTSFSFTINNTTTWPYNLSYIDRHSYYAFMVLSNTFYNRVIGTYSYDHVAALQEQYFVGRTLRGSSYNYWTSLSFDILVNHNWNSANKFYSTNSFWTTSLGGISYSTWRTNWSGYTYNSSGLFTPDSVRYVGLRFIDSSDVNIYGWVRVVTPHYGSSIEIKDWAYQTAAGRGLYTGIDTVPPTAHFDVAPGVSFYIDITFDEEILDSLNRYDLDIVKGTIDSLVEIVPYREYRVYINPAAYGMLVLSIPENTIKDLWGHNNEEISISYNLGDAPNALSDIDAAGFKLYPNPVSTELNVQLPDEGTVTISDAAGRVVLMKKNVRDEVIDVSNMNPGMYMVKIQTRNNTAIQKIVKQ